MTHKPFGEYFSNLAETFWGGNKVKLGALIKYLGVPQCPLNMMIGNNNTLNT